MSRRKRRTFNIEQKSAAVVKHLQDNVPVSQICEELEIHPNQYYDWQKQALSNLNAAFTKERDKELSKLHSEIAKVKAKVARKNEAISELLEEHILLKKELGVA